MASKQDCGPSSQGLSRRRMIALGVSAAGGFAGATIAGCTSPGSSLGIPPSASSGTSQNESGLVSGDLGSQLGGSFPPSVQHTVETILQAKGAIAYGLLQIEVDRNDIRGVTLHGTPMSPPFEINGMLNFQSMGGSRVIMNSDLCLKAEELDPFIDQLIEHNIFFQAEHQHFYDFNPLVWFIHFRAQGDAEAVARGVKAALNVTSTPFPQAPPQNPSTRLPAAEIGKILGAKPAIGAKGIVNFQLPRAEPIFLGGIRVNPYLNMPTTIGFMPLVGGGAAAVPDFGMIPSEINHVVGRMRGLQWDIGCLYNQETDERPQLFFSHQFKTGNSIQLAHEIRDGLNLTNVKFID